MKRRTRAVRLVVVTTLWLMSVAIVAAGDWLQLGYDARNTSVNPGECLIDPSNVATLDETWSNPVPCTINTGVSVAGGVVYSTCGENYLFAFDQETGSVLWQHYTSGGYELRSSPAIVDGRLFHAATFAFELLAFEPTESVLLFGDGFESGDTSAWSAMASER